jgi:hypothetical protein
LHNAKTAGYLCLHLSHTRKQLLYLLIQTRHLFWYMSVPLSDQSSAHI